jgi:hypothetical protein
MARNSCSRKYHTAIDDPETPPIRLGTLAAANHATDDKVNLIHAAASSIQYSDVLRLNSEISLAETRLDSLRRERDLLRTQYCLLNPQCVPIHRLPVEILSQIFLDALTFHRNCQFMFPRRKAIMLLTQICQRWRDAAINQTPTLWSSLYFDLRARYLNRELQMAPIWLGRSRATPLTLALRSFQEGPQTHPIIDIILDHTPRFRSLYLQTPLSIVHSLQRAKGQIPRLYHLIIETDSDSSPPPQSFNIFEAAPKLCNVELAGKVSLLMPKLPWPQLQELRLLHNQITVADFASVLRGSPNLVECEISVKGSLTHSPQAVFPSQHPNLRDLVIELENDPPLFQGLKLPALLSFYCSGIEWCPQDDFLSFLCSSPLLQKLVFADFFNTDSNEASCRLIGCLQRTPNLLELGILDSASSAISVDLWDGMTHRPLSSCLVPKLRCLKVTRFYREFDYDAFVAMVESRWRVDLAQGGTQAAVERIQGVSVAFVEEPELVEGYFSIQHDAVHSGSFARLRRFRSEGLGVVVADMPGQDPDDSPSVSCQNRGRIHHSLS